MNTSIQTFLSSLYLVVFYSILLVALLFYPYNKIFSQKEREGEKRQERREELIYCFNKKKERKN